MWACELVFTGVWEFSKFLPENIVLTSADYDMYPIRFFSKIFPNTVGPCLVRQSVEKAKFSTLCKFALCKCLRSLCDLKKIPHYANFFRFFLIFRTMQDYIRLLKKVALCKSALSKCALNKDLL